MRIATADVKPRDIVTPLLTPLSTNATCQLDKTENSAPNALRTALVATRRRTAPSAKENSPHRNMCEMFEINGRLRGRPNAGMRS